MYISQKIYSNG